jgi:hypothetical protein
MLCSSALFALISLSQDPAGGRDAAILRDFMEFGGLPLLMLLLAAAFCTVRSIRSFLAQLADALSRAGDGAARPLPLDGPLEFVFLARSVNAIAARLAAEQDRRHAAEQLLCRVEADMARSGEMLAARLRGAEALSRLNRRMQACATESELAELLSRLIPDILPGTAGMLLMVNPSRNLAEAASSWADSSGSQAAFEPNACWALRRGRAHRSHRDGVADMPCAHFEADAADDHVCLPLMAHGEAIGLLTFAGLRSEPGTASSLKPSPSISRWRWPTSAFAKRCRTGRCATR